MLSTPAVQGGEFSHAFPVQNVGNVNSKLAFTATRVNSLFTSSEEGDDEVYGTLGHFGNIVFEKDVTAKDLDITEANLDASKFDVQLGSYGRVKLYEGDNKIFKQGKCDNKQYTHLFVRVGCVAIDRLGNPTGSPTIFQHHKMEFSHIGYDHLNQGLPLVFANDTYDIGSSIDFKARALSVDTNTWVHLNLDKISRDPNLEYFAEVRATSFGYTYTAGVIPQYGSEVLAERERMAHYDPYQ